MRRPVPFALSLSKGPCIVSLSKGPCIVSLSKGPCIVSLSNDLSLSKGLTHRGACADK